MTDVLGGYLFGGGWLAFSLDLYLLLRREQEKGRDADYNLFSTEAKGVRRA